MRATFLQRTLGFVEESWLAFSEQYGCLEESLSPQNKEHSSLVGKLYLLQWIVSKRVARSLWEKYSLC